MTTKRGGHRLGRIGDLARATGLTARTLRHYESVGLLPAPSRTQGKQRLYDAQDVARLYRVCALRDLGLGLTEIRHLLIEGSCDFDEVLRAHLARVDDELRRLQELRALLAQASARAKDVPMEDLLATIEAMSRVARHGAARRERSARATDAEAPWRDLGARLRQCLRAGEPPSARRPAELAREARRLLQAFAGDDPSVLGALAHLRKVVEPGDLAGWDAALLRYLDDALVHLEQEKHP